MNHVFLREKNCFCSNGGQELVDGFDQRIVFFTRRLGRVYHTRHAGYYTRVLPVPDPWVAWVWHSISYPRVGYLGYQNQSLPGYRVRPGYNPGRVPGEVG